MRECPNCGCSLDEASTVCTECGQSLPGESHQQPTQSTGTQPRRQPTSGPTESGANQSHHGQYSEQHRQSNEWQTQQTNTSRRNLLVYGGGAIAALGGGYLLLGDDDSSSSGPRVIDYEQDGTIVGNAPSGGNLVSWDFYVTVENDGSAGQVRVVVEIPGANIEEDEIVRMEANEQREVVVGSVTYSNAEIESGGKNVYAEAA